MTSALKKISQNILLLFFGCMVAFLIAEIFLRIYNPFVFSVKGDKIVLLANEKYVLKNEKIKKLDDTIILKTNSLGFRGEDPPKEFNNYLTTITIGGSTTKCGYLSEGKTWPDVLGKKLKDVFRNSWINNAGLDGHSTYGHIVLMEDYIKNIKPQNVIFLTGINDEGNNEYQKDFEDDKSFMKDQFYFMSIKGIGRMLANHSEVFSVALNIHRYIKASIVGVDRDEEVTLIGSLVLELSEDVEKRAIQKHKKFLKDYETRINKLIKLSRDNGIEPIFVTQPALYGIGKDDVTNVDLVKIYKRETINGGLAWKTLELYNDVVRQVVEREKILVVDLAKELPKSSRYYYDFSHYTNEGAEKVAEIIFKYLCPFYAKKYKEYQIKDCSVTSNN